MRTLASLMFLASVARAGFIATPIVTGVGPYTYSYSIANVSDDPIFEISFIADGAITNIISPSGWAAGTLPVGSETSVTWVSTDIPFDIVKNANLSGFSLMSSAPPGSVVFTARTESFATDSTTTTGPVTPATVPEPGTAFLLLPAVIALSIKHARVRRALKNT
jgi:hypothetical protein